MIKIEYLKSHKFLLLPESQDMLLDHESRVTGCGKPIIRYQVRHTISIYNELAEHPLEKNTFVYTFIDRINSLSFNPRGILAMGSGSSAFNNPRKN